MERTSRAGGTAPTVRPPRSDQAASPGAAARGLCHTEPDGIAPRSERPDLGVLLPDSETGGAT